MLAEAEFPERRMGRLLASDTEVLPDRLVVASRFLAAKRVRAAGESFYWLMREVELGHETRQRAVWARQFGEGRIASDPANLGGIKR